MKIDKRLIAACKKGDQRAQYDLFKVCYSPLMSVCARYKNEPADRKSLLNLGFYKILKNIDKYKMDVPFQGWIKRIMINCIIDEFRKEKKYKEKTFLEIKEGFANDIKLIQFNDVEQVFAEERLRQMLLALPERSRQVFNLFAIDGFKHSEISKMLSISVSTSKWHVAEARRTLKNVLKKELEKEKKFSYE